MLLLKRRKTLQPPHRPRLLPRLPLRDALTREAAHQVTRLTKASGNFTPIGEIVDEKSIVNSIIALNATGGSTNHTLHMPAIAMSAGIILTWDDMADLSEVVPTLSHVYPNGKADINHFQAAGGMSFLIRENYCQPTIGILLLRVGAGL